MNGYIKLHRKITEWGWYKDTNTKVLFLHLLLTANFKENTFKGKTIGVGQVVVGRKQLAKELGLSEQSVRTSLNHLKSTNEITIQATNQYSVITIVKWEDYQLECEELTNKVTNEPPNEQPTTNQQLTTTEEGKNIRTKEDIYIGLDESCISSFKEFVKLRKQLKKPMTDNAIKRAINKLNKLSNGDTDLAIRIIEQTIDHCWQDFYPIKEEVKKGRYDFLDEV